MFRKTRIATTLAALVAAPIVTSADDAAAYVQVEFFSQANCGASSGPTTTLLDDSATEVLDVANFKAFRMTAFPSGDFGEDAVAHAFVDDEGIGHWVRVHTRTQGPAGLTQSPRKSACVMLGIEKLLIQRVSPKKQVRSENPDEWLKFPTVLDIEWADTCLLESIAATAQYEAQRELDKLQEEMAKKVRGKTKKNRIKDATPCVSVSANLEWDPFDENGQEAGNSIKLYIHFTFKIGYTYYATMAFNMYPRVDHGEMYVGVTADPEIVVTTPDGPDIVKYPIENSLKDQINEDDDPETATVTQTIEEEINSELDSKLEELYANGQQVESVVTMTAPNTITSPELPILLNIGDGEGQDTVDNVVTLVVVSP